MPNQPSRGISAWKMPKSKAVFMAMLHTVRLNVTPHTIDTVKQSMARATPRNHKSNKSIIVLFAGVKIVLSCGKRFKRGIFVL